MKIIVPPTAAAVSHRFLPLDKRNVYVCRIAGVTLQLLTEHELNRASPRFRPFESRVGKPDVRIRFLSRNPLVLPEGRERFRDHIYSVRETSEGLVRVFRDKNGIFYGISYYDPETHLATVEYDAEQKKAFSDLSVCFGHMGLEEIFLTFDRLILHAAFIRTEYGGILFSGPSGIGKSTQADLWGRYRNARLINGDRPVLYASGKEWIGCGSPYAGSSECYRNESCSIRAIVFLEKEDGKGCRAISIRPAEAFSKLYSQAVVNTWNRSFVIRASDLLMRMALQVPAYRLWRTPDFRAVHVLEELLESTD